MITVERFNDPRYARPRYRLRYSERQVWLKDGHTCGSYRHKRDALNRAVELAFNGAEEKAKQS